MGACFLLSNSHSYPCPFHLVMSFFGGSWACICTAAQPPKSCAHSSRMSIKPASKNRAGLAVHLPQETGQIHRLSSSILNTTLTQPPDTCRVPTWLPWRPYMQCVHANQSPQTCMQKETKRKTNRTSPVYFYSIFFLLPCHVALTSRILASAHRPTSHACLRCPPAQEPNRRQNKSGGGQSDPDRRSSAYRLPFALKSLGSNHWTKKINKVLVYRGVRFIGGPRCPRHDKTRHLALTPNHFYLNYWFLGIQTTKSRREPGSTAFWPDLSQCGVHSAPRTPVVPRGPCSRIGPG